jgi:hypothetical protein
VGERFDEEIYEKHADELIRFATGLVGATDAADVVSSAVLSCITSRPWPAVSNSRAYLFQGVLTAARQLHGDAGALGAVGLLGGTVPVTISDSVIVGNIPAANAPDGSATMKSAEVTIDSDLALSNVIVWANKGRGERRDRLRPRWWHLERFDLRRPDTLAQPRRQRRHWELPQR